MEDSESRSDWHVVDSSGQDPPGLASRRLSLAQLFGLAGHALDDLFVHEVERTSDGERALALMVGLDQIELVPPETRSALEASGLRRLPLAVITGSPADFAAEWSDLGQIPDGG